MSEVSITLRPYPFPFRAALSVCNDTDGMDWAVYEDWHSFVSGSGDTPYGKGLSLEVADSFWVWSDNGAFALRHAPPWDRSALPSPEAARIADLARGGWLDVLHSFGDWGGTYQLTPDDIRRGMDLYDELNARIPAYVNHGGGWLRQHNLGGPWATYQSGDDPATGSYHLDQLLERGFRYFWLDHLSERHRFGGNLKLERLSSMLRETRNQRWTHITELNSREERGRSREVFTGLDTEDTAAIAKFLSNTVLLPVVARDDNEILGFNRFRGIEGPTATNFGDQVSGTHLDLLEEAEGACIVYQHFGVWRALGRGKWHPSQQEGRVPALDDNAVWAFRDLADRQHDGRLFVTTTGRLLHYLWVRSNLVFSTRQAGDIALIEVGKIECPVYGTSEPTPRDLQGIAFQIPAGTAEVKVTLNGRELVTQRAADPYFGDGDAVYVPWQRLEFPTLNNRPARTMSTKRVGPAAPQTKTPIVHRSLSAEQASRMATLTEEMMMERKPAIKGLKPDLTSIVRKWHNLKVPTPLASSKSYIRKMHAEPFEAYLNRVRRLTSGGGTVLDAGCGTATWSFALSNLFDRTIAIDKTRNRVDAARWLVDSFGTNRIDVDYGDITDLDVPDNSVDFVFCYGVVIAGLPLRSVLREFRRVTKPGGAIYMCVNGLGWSYYLRDERGKASDKDATAGRRGIFNTLCVNQQADANSRTSRFLAAISSSEETTAKVASAIGITAEELHPLIGALGLAADLTSARLPHSPNAPSPEQFATTVDRMLAAAGISGTPLAQTLDAIGRECGDEYRTLFANDLLLLVTARRDAFSHATGGLGRTPEGAKAVCDELGLVDFRSAGEGELVGYTGADVSAPNFFPGEFDGKQAVWEFMVRKPKASAPGLWPLRRES